MEEGLIVRGSNGWLGRLMVVSRPDVAVRFMSSARQYLRVEVAARDAVTPDIAQKLTQARALRMGSKVQGRIPGGRLRNRGCGGPGTPFVASWWRALAQGWA